MVATCATSTARRAVTWEQTAREKIADAICTNLEETTAGWHLSVSRSSLLATRSSHRLAIGAGKHVFCLGVPPPDLMPLWPTQGYEPTRDRAVICLRLDQKLAAIRVVISLPGNLHATLVDSLADTEYYASAMGNLVLPGPLWRISIKLKIVLPVYDVTFGRRLALPLLCQQIPWKHSS